MSLWFLLLVVLLTAASVAFFGFGYSAYDTTKRKRYVAFGIAFAVAAVSAVIAGVVRGKVRRRMSDNFDLDDFDSADFNDGNDAGNDVFLDDFDFPKNQGVTSTDATTLFGK